MSKIEWTEKTWNPTIGCTKVSQGCKNCYAEVMSHRLQAMGVKGYEDGFKFKVLLDRFQAPFKTKKPTMFFVNSMSDFFHEQLNRMHIETLFNVMEECHQHTFQILTKRATKLSSYGRVLKIPSNVWLGVTVEDKKSGVPRISSLRSLDCSVKFLSIEPLLEDLGQIDLQGIDWVIVGGESGPKARSMKKEWVLNIKKQCEEQGVAFFFKQWGAWGVDGVKRNKKANGCKLDGVEYKAYPKPLISRRSYE